MTALATDDFNRADGALGGNWGSSLHAQAITIVSNAATTSGAGGDAAHRYTAVTAPDDGYVQGRLPVTHADGVGAGYGVIWRASSGGTYYRFIFSASGYSLDRFASGSFGATVASGSGTTFAAGDIGKMKWVGNAWTLYKNDVQFATGTDGNIASGNAAGLAYSSTSNAADNLDDFEFGDFQSAFVPDPPFVRANQNPILAR